MAENHNVYIFDYSIYIYQTTFYNNSYKILKNNHEKGCLTMCGCMMSNSCNRIYMPLFMAI